MGLFALGTGILANLEDVAATAGITLPALRYVAPGPFGSVSFDCDQVTVSIDLVYRGAPGAPVSGYVQAAEPSANITVAIVRLCMPTSEDETPPLAADQATAAAITLADADLLWRNAAQILGADGCKHHGLVSVQPLEIQGAAGGAKLTGSIDLLTLPA